MFSAKLAAVYDLYLCTMTAKTLYPYTLQPVAYHVSEAEQRRAQLLIWRSTNKISRKVWLILAAIVALSILGLIFIENYSTIFCWVALAGVVIFYVARIYGLEWYVKRKMNEFPVQEMKGIRLGVQPHGMIMRQQMNGQEGTGSIAWQDVFEWYDTPEFLLLNFKTKGQQGAYMLPKRMDSKNFAFSSIRKHLNEVVGPAKTL